MPIKLRCKPLVTGATTLLITIAILSALTACGSSTPATPAPTPTLTASQARGKELFGKLPGNCATCHSLDPDVKLIGPSLAGVATRAATRIAGLEARYYLELSIIKPNEYIVAGYSNLMPPNLGKQLDSEQLQALVDFLLTLQ